MGGGISDDYFKPVIGLASESLSLPLVYKSDRTDSEINSMTKAQLMERLAELLGGSENA